MTQPMTQQRVAHFALDSMNTLVIPRPQWLNLHLPLPPQLSYPVAYHCDLAGVITKGTLDEKARLRIPNAHLADTARLTVWCFGVDQEPITWTLQLGSLLAADSVAGIQSRLNNLGLNVGPVDGIVGSKTKAAIRNFQNRYGLAVDGEAGNRTVEKLKSVHGC